MRQINVSTKVFARIWSLRLEGEESEDDILRRVLLGPERVSAQVENSPKSDGGGGPGFYDQRHNLQFPEGFEVRWRYKGRDYFAVASGGYWVREDTAEQFRSLNELTASVADSPQNVWSAWEYENLDGLPTSIHALRLDGGGLTKWGEVKYTGHPIKTGVFG